MMTFFGYEKENARLWHCVASHSKCSTEMANKLYDFAEEVEESDSEPVPDADCKKYLLEVYEEKIANLEKYMIENDNSKTYMCDNLNVIFAWNLLLRLSQASNVSLPIDLEGKVKSYLSNKCKGDIRIRSK